MPALTNPPSPNYRGRFAPSPTGALHFGSLVAALGSYLDARAHGGQWLVRIEDIDAPRTVPGAAAHILRTLEAFGFTWDAPVLLQSERQAAYHAALMRLQADGKIYPCACSRSQILRALQVNERGETNSTNAANTSDTARLQQPHDTYLYPGTCRNGLKAGTAARAWRLQVPDRALTFTDRIQGQQTQNLAQAVGDFVLHRADGQIAYQLAVVVDDAAQGITHVVRGADLLDSTARQLYLQQCLGLPTVRYAHLPVVVNAAGEKISKQTLATPVDAAHGNALLVAALQFLGHTAPEALKHAPLDDFWRFAIAAWSIQQVPAVRGIFPG